MERMKSNLTGVFVLLLLFAAAVTTANSQENPTKVIDLNALAVRGEALANEDPLALELRNLQPDDSARRGFDIGMGVAEGHTLPGPGKDRTCASLPAGGPEGCSIAVLFSVERNRNADFAARGAAIVKVDERVAAARNAEPANPRIRGSSVVFYRLGFDIATGIFGEPALGAKGNTATGPGSLKIRDSLSYAGQVGFNASVKFHLGQDAPPSAPQGRPRTPGEVTAIDNSQPANSIRVSIRYRKEYGYKNNSGLFVKGPTSCEGFAISAKPTSPGRLESLIGIHTDSSMRESNGQYVCDFLVTDVPLNREIGVRADVSNSPAWLTDAWLGGSEPQPLPGHQRMIRNGIQNVTLTDSAPRATLVFEMVYAPPLAGPR